MHKFICVVLSVCVLGISSGCAGLRPKASTVYMTTYVSQPPLTKETDLKGNLHLEHAIGASQKTSFPLSTNSYIHDMDFTDAIERSLKNAHLLSADKTSRYALEVEIMSFEMPFFVVISAEGFISINYKLIDTKTKKTIWTKLIRTSDIQSGIDVTSACIKVAENMVKENFKQAIKAMINLNIKADIKPVVVKNINTEENQNVN